MSSFNDQIEKIKQKYEKMLNIDGDIADPKEDPDFQAKSFLEQ